MANVDKETKEVLTEGDFVLALTNSQGWNIVKGKLDARILDLQNINNLNLDSKEDMLTDLKSRKMAADLLFAWLKDDIYGFIEQQEANRSALIDPKNGGFIEVDNVK